MKIQLTKGQIEKLVENTKSNDTHNLLNEQIAPLLSKYFGKRLVSKFESSFGDDVVKNLENLFKGIEPNILTNNVGKKVIVSRTGTQVPIETIRIALDNVASGKISVDDVVALLPKTLKDGTDFRSIIRNQLKNAKPKPTLPKPITPKSPSTKLPPLSIIDDTTSLNNYLQSEISKFGLRMPPQKWINDFINDINVFVNNEYKKQGFKNLEITLNNLEGALRKMSTDQRKNFLEKALNNVNELSKKNKTFFGLYNGMKGANLFTKEGIKNFVDDYRKYAKYILIVNAITFALDGLRKLVDKEKKQPYQYHVGDPDWKLYLYIKIAASIIPYLNVVLTTALAGESLVRTGISFGRENKQSGGLSDDELNKIEKAGSQ